MDFFLLGGSFSEELNRTLRNTPMEIDILFILHFNRYDVVTSVDDSAILASW